MLQTIFRTNQRLDVKKITKMARKNPSFDLEQNPLEARCTIRFSKIPPSSKIPPRFFAHSQTVDLKIRVIAVRSHIRGFFLFLFVLKDCIGGNMA